MLNIINSTFLKNYTETNIKIHSIFDHLEEFSISFKTITVTLFHEQFSVVISS